MAGLRFPKSRVARIMGCLQLVLGGLVIIVSLASLFRYYSAGFFHHNEDICRRFRTSSSSSSGGGGLGYDGFDTKALSDRIEEVLDKMENLQNKLEEEVQKLEKERDELGEGHISKVEFKRYLEEEVTQPLYNAHISLRQIRLPKPEGIRNTTFREEPLINYFTVEEIRKYITPKENRHKRMNMYKTGAIHNTIGHACVMMKEELEEYMSYDVASYCKDDWNLALKLMVHGCDPLPRRRCLARASKTYSKPYPINESLWKVPDDRNVRWGNYKCKNFGCLTSNNLQRGFTKCISCFELDKEKLLWVGANNSSSPVDFSISQVLEIKAAGDIRIGLDHSTGTGTFAARMWEKNVTIISTALNLGAPFSEMIALRGLLPLHITPNQRLPFFDNTMDLIHTTGFLDGWIDMLLLDFILFDWDRILRPRGLLWIDKFFCNRTDLEDYMYMFLQFKYKKHKWVVAPKSVNEVYLSAVLEKPARSV